MNFREIILKAIKIGGYVAVVVSVLEFGLKAFDGVNSVSNGDSSGNLE
jgi:hypothetical protein